MGLWNKDQAFGLPKGTIRGILAISLIGVFCYAVVIGANKGQITITGEDIKSLVIMIVTFYFAFKMQNKE